MECCSAEFAKKQFPDQTAFLRELADIWGKHSKQTVRYFRYLAKYNITISPNFSDIKNYLNR